MTTTRPPGQACHNCRLFWPWAIWDGERGFCRSLGPYGEGPEGEGEVMQYDQWCRWWEACCNIIKAP